MSPIFGVWYKTEEIAPKAPLLLVIINLLKKNLSRVYFYLHKSGGKFEKQAGAGAVPSSVKFPASYALRS